MSKEIKDKVVPKLRFPEFRNAGEWAKMQFDELCKFTRGPFGGALKKEIFVKNGYAVYEQSHAIYNDFSSFRYHVNEEKFNELKRFSVLPDDIIMSCSGTMGKFSIVPKQSKKGVINQALLKLTVKKGYDTNFIKTTLELPINQDKLLSQSAGGAIKNVVEVAQIKEIELYIPLLKEQQKIADCLSSLDELITAQSQKLEALKAHKKGLMQQLFPAECETVPKLRFAEFKDSGEWSEKSIQELIDDKFIIGHLDGNHGALYPSAEEFSKEGIPYITANDFLNGVVDFKKCKYLPEQRAMKFKKGVAKDGDILFAHNATVGPVAKLNTDFDYVVLSTTATYFRCDNELLLNDFLKFAFSSPKFINQYTRVMSQSTRNQVPITTQRSFTLQLPKIEEQQKVASCLSSLEEFINAQAKKIESLKTHKKGLMQQLFPNTQDASE